MENLTELFEQSVKKYWENPALSDYQVRTETYGELAQHIEHLHLVWRAMGLTKGDKIALNARRLEIFATGGAAIPPAIEQLLAFQINMPFITGYGMPECAPLLAVGKVGQYKAKSCGETIESLSVRIASPDGNMRR